MWPWGHLAVGYLLFAATSRRRRARPPDGAETILIALGTQFPDLIDKPLAWSVGVLPNGRSLAHSVFVAALVVALVLWLARRAGAPTLGGAFGLGYASHLAADALPALLYGVPSDLAFLAWPVLPPVEYDTTQSFVAHFAGIEPTPFFLAQVGLTAAALVVWLRDGAPGPGLVLDRVGVGRAGEADR
ncbi:metal-dependent hydrolase [Halostella sp. JP-L12]|uniref:metal-dependent hydrolase n=1 Tax=Halostella TaxID=1843185 RepID=UPI000EF84B7E|nr:MULTISPECIES: metal-dependent hydrolase [Halostella]NHN46659.1 metal-dependent hydrolase [Halostella sp. JP-L12]